MSTQFIKGGPGSGPRPGQGKKEKVPSGHKRVQAAGELADDLLNMDHGDLAALIEEMPSFSGYLKEESAGDIAAQILEMTTGDLMDLTLNDPAFHPFIQDYLPKGKKSMKSIFDDALKGGPGSGRHKGSGTDANHTASKEATEMAKNSSNRALAKVAIHKIGSEDSQRAARAELASRGVSIEQADKLAGSKSEPKTAETRDEAMSRIWGNKRADSGYNPTPSSGRTHLSDSSFRTRKSFSFKSLSESIEARVDELSLKGGPGSGRHKGDGKQDEPTSIRLHSVGKLSKQLEAKDASGKLSRSTKVAMQEVRDLLSSQRPDDPKLVKEYIDEAEHQDGNSTWKDNYSTKQDVLDDFDLYRDNYE